MSNLYQDAILDAKALRASAIANAKAALEEAFEPKIQEMLRAKLSEEEVSEIAEAEEIEEVKHEEESMEEGVTVEEAADITNEELDKILAELDSLSEDAVSEETISEAKEEEGEEEEAEEGEEGEAEEAEAPEAEEEAVGDETKVIDITLGDLKQVLQSVMGGQAETAEEPTADSEAEAEISLDEILDELSLEEGPDASHVGHYDADDTAHADLQGDETFGRQEESVLKEAKFDKAEAEKIIQLYQANKGELDPEAVKAIDAAVADASAGGLEEGSYADAVLIAQIGGGALLTAMLAALAGVGYAAIKGKLPKRPGKGIGDIGPMGEAEKGGAENVAALMKQAQTNPDEFLKSVEKGAINEVLATTVALLGASALAGLAVALATGVAFHIKKQGGLAKVAKTAGPGIMKTVAEAEEGNDELTSIANQMKAAFKSGNFKQVFVLAKDFYTKAAPYFKSNTKIGDKFKSVLNSLGKKAEQKPAPVAEVTSEGTAELEEAKATIETLRKDLQEVNLLNAKYLYMNKLFKSKSLTESQKVKVINALDRATTVAEVKNTYETLKESFETKKQQIKESIGFASKSAGMAPKANIVEADGFISRWQKLAGIK